MKYEFLIPIILAFIMMFLVGLFIAVDHQASNYSNIVTKSHNGSSQSDGAPYNPQGNSILYVPFTLHYDRSWM
ncbi:MAG: hypothetical protein AB8B77_08925 [Alphaproteobacteria bacterium]